MYYVMHNFPTAAEYFIPCKPHRREASYLKCKNTYYTHTTDGDHIPPPRLHNMKDGSRLAGEGNIRIFSLRFGTDF